MQCKKVPAKSQKLAEIVAQRAWRAPRPRAAGAPRPRPCAAPSRRRGAPGRPATGRATPARRRLRRGAPRAPTRRRARSASERSRRTLGKRVFEDLEDELEPRGLEQERDQVRQRVVVAAEREDVDREAEREALLLDLTVRRADADDDGARLDAELLLVLLELGREPRRRVLALV